MQLLAAILFQLVIINPSDNLMLVKIDAIDHTFSYPFPVPVCMGEMSPHQQWKLSEREHNPSPHRYQLIWWDYSRRTLKNKRSYIIKITPNIKKVVVLPDKIIFFYEDNHKILPLN